MPQDPDETYLDHLEREGEAEFEAGYEEWERQVRKDHPIPDLDLIGNYLRKVKQDERDDYGPNMFEVLANHFTHVSFIVLNAYRLAPGKDIDISYSNKLRFHIDCEPKAIDGVDEIWRQFYVNDKWVGNAWGMQKEISKECFDEFLRIFGKALIEALLK